MRLTRQLLSLILVATLVACGPPPKRVHRIKAKREAAVRMLRIDDHRYAYHDNAGVWWWYLMSTSSPPSPSRAAYASAFESGRPASLPNGGTWSKGAKPTEEEEKQAEEIEAEVEVIGEGEPAGAPAEEITAEEAAVPADSPSESSQSGTGGESSSGSESGGSSGGGDSGGGDGGSGG